MPVSFLLFSSFLQYKNSILYFFIANYEEYGDSVIKYDPELSIFSTRATDVPPTERSIKRVASGPGGDSTGDA